MIKYCLPPKRAKEMRMEMTAPMVVMALRQPRGKKHIVVEINYDFRRERLCVGL